MPKRYYKIINLGKIKQHTFAFHIVHWRNINKALAYEKKTR